MREGDFVENSIVFTTQAGANASALLQPRPGVSIATTSGLDEVGRYLSRTENAKLTMIRTSDSASKRIEFVSTESQPLNDLFIVEVAVAEDTSRMLEYLNNDARVRTANRPTKLRPVESSAPTLQSRLLGRLRQIFSITDDGPPEPWRLGGFDGAPFLIPIDAPPITVIDIGHPEHPALANRVCYSGDSAPQLKRIGHGLNVVGVITGDAYHESPRGVCTAQIDYYNVWGGGGSNPPYSCARFHYALSDFIQSRSRVLNLSVSGIPVDDTIVAELREAECRGKAVVAAMPDAGVSGGAFPCNQPFVISVGTRESYNPHSSCEAWISASGSGLMLLAPDSKFEIGSGTSFAAPAVSGAVWLALSVCTELSAEDVRCLLKESATGITGYAGRRHRAYGWGALNVKQLYELVGGARGCGRQ